MSAAWNSANEIWYRRRDGTWLSVRVQAREGRLDVSEPQPRFQNPCVSDLAFAGERILADRRVSELAPTEVRLVSNWNTLLQKR